MNTGKKKDGRGTVLSFRQRQKQLGRGLRLMYEQVLREPIPVDIVDALHAAECADSAVSSRNGRFPPPG